MENFHGIGHLPLSPMDIPYDVYCNLFVAALLRF